MVVRCPRCGSKRVSKNQRSNKFEWECDMCKREFNSSSSGFDVNAEFEKVEQLRRERRERERVEQERLIAQKREREEKERREKAERERLEKQRQERIERERKERLERERLEKQRQERIERERKERLERGRRREEKDRMVRMYKCPNCGNPLYKKDNISGIGQFYHCEHCGHTRSSWDTNNLNTANFSANTLNRCPRCGGAIIRKLGGPRGIFYGCANFPMCDFAYSSLDQNVSQTFTSNITSAPKSYYNEPKTSKKEIWSVDDKRKYKKLMEKKRKKQNKSDISNKSRDKNKRIKDESYNDYIFRINSQQKVSNPKANKEKKKQAKVTKAKLLRYIDGCNIDNSLKVNMKIEVRRGKITDMETLRRRINVEEINYEKVEQQKVSNPKANKAKKKQTTTKTKPKNTQTYQQRIEGKTKNTEKPVKNYTQKVNEKTNSNITNKNNNNAGKWAIILTAIAICLIFLIAAAGINNYNSEYGVTDELENQNSAKGVHLTIWNENSDFNLYNDFNHFKKGHFIIVVMKDSANWEAMEGCLVSVNLKNKETEDEYDIDCTITENSYGYIDTDELPLGEYEVYASYYGDEDHYANYYTDIEIVT